MVDPFVLIDGDAEYVGGWPFVVAAAYGVEVVVDGEGDDLVGCSWQLWSEAEAPTKRIVDLDGGSLDGTACVVFVAEIAAQQPQFAGEWSDTRVGFAGLEHGQLNALGAVV